MGRITVFALEECGHCRRVKNALKKRQLPYVEISLSTHPHRRSDMLALSDRLTVPQVFFGDEHVGGADDTLEVLDQWDRDTTKTPLEQYQSAIASQPDPTDPRLRISTEPPVVVDDNSLPTERPDHDKIQLPDGSSTSVLELTEQLKACLPREELPYQMKFYKNCFTGKAAVQSFQKNFMAADGMSLSEEAAIRFGSLLQERMLLHHVVHDHAFDNTSKFYFRLQCHQTPQILNSYRIWYDCESPTPSQAVKLVTKWQKQLTKILASVTDDDGGVNYAQAAQQEDFSAFEEAVCQLQSIDLAPFDRDHMLAFGINVYNLMVLLAFVKVGIPNSASTRSAFFGQVQFQIGPHTYSLNDWEHGILRGNRKPPYTLFSPFSKSDPRHQFVQRYKTKKQANVESQQDSSTQSLGVDSEDNANSNDAGGPLTSRHFDFARLHFALNCGAKSCPPIKTFTAEAIDEELRIVAMAFCEDDNNLRIDTKDGSLHVSKILYWYQNDFVGGKGETELPSRLLSYLRHGTQKRQNMLRMLLGEDESQQYLKAIENGVKGVEDIQSIVADSNYTASNPIAVKYLPYDWSSNSSVVGSKSFDPSNLQAQYLSLTAAAASWL